MIEAKVSADQANEDGQTALLWAACMGHLAVVQWLVTEAKVSADQANKHALDLAAPKVLEWLKLHVRNKN
jgi:hypothetical protein